MLPRPSLAKLHPTVHLPGSVARYPQICSRELRTCFAGIHLGTARLAGFFRSLTGRHRRYSPIASRSPHPHRSLVGGAPSVLRRSFLVSRSSPRTYLIYTPAASTEPHSPSFNDDQSCATALPPLLLRYPGVRLPAGMGEISTSILQSVFICVATWSLLRFLRQLLSKNHLDNIPGPAPTSWSRGTWRRQHCIIVIRGC